MTVCKIALANLVMWTRDRYLPPPYAHATWQRLVPFFRLPGRITWGAKTVEVELRPFNDRQLNRDLAVICASECRFSTTARWASSPLDGQSSCM